MRPGTTSADSDFEEATLDHLDVLYAVARSVARPPLEADDLVQETYLRALQGWRRRRPEQVRSWLVMICLNVFRSQLRRRHARPVEAPTSDLDTAFFSPSDTAREALSRLTSGAVVAAVRQLPDAQRRTIVLMDLCGFTAAAVAQRLDVPRGTVLARVHRGRRRLVKLLADEAIRR